uniref:Uncharacterized protein n=1 Tax=Scinaia undulata TaxID=1884664 RepID=A0A1G4NXU5_9FLOR|nr:Hypothetical protein ycf37 [Scinaia undulata]SCW23319.1 Hypothetical protein ycf37 [Scinaia undulata]
MSSIVPIAYLFLVSTILTPITSMLLIQTFNFNYKRQSLSQLKKGNNSSQEYTSANIYMDQKEWANALTVLDMQLHKKDNITNYMIAKYSNAIGFILQKTSHGKLAAKYYYYSHQTCPEYSYAKKNLDTLNEKIHKQQIDKSG